MGQSGGDGDRPGKTRPGPHKGSGVYLGWSTVSSWGEGVQLQGIIDHEQLLWLYTSLTDLIVNSKLSMTTGQP